EFRDGEVADALFPVERQRALAVQARGRRQRGADAQELAAVLVLQFGQEQALMARAVVESQLDADQVGLAAGDGVVRGDVGTDLFKVLHGGRLTLKKRLCYQPAPISPEPSMPAAPADPRRLAILAAVRAIP